MPIQKKPSEFQLTLRDIIFAAINGLIFGSLLPVTLKNLMIQLSAPKSIAIAIFFAVLAMAGVTVGYFLSRLAKFFYQLAKFGAVGAANFAIDIGVYNLLIFLTGISSGLLVDSFAAISFVASVINSYLWNKFWAFKKTKTKEVGKEFLQFFTVSTIGLFLNIGILHLIVNIVGPLGAIKPTIWANIGKATASVCVLSWNFIGYKFWVFKK